MPNIIHLLPSHVSNQIAAGEVVQRPASIVKELIENSIDAGATKIEVIIRDGGKNLVQVVDNGKGMSKEDAVQAFKRHATSKISTTEDIYKILTKGFRGEALSSIAAVAQVELKTITSEDQVGTMLYMEGGELQFQEPTSLTEGTSFSVKNLFYNIPARRKFLKNNNIEFRHIIDEFQRIALSHPEIELDLYHQDEIVFKLRKTTPMLRIVDIFGRKLHPQLVPIKEDLDWIKLSGYVGKPEASKKTRGEQFLFANKRFFRSPYLNKAVQEAFEGLLQVGYLPTFFLFLEIDPEKIDVNIHPQKTEVKFEDESLIFALLRSTIKKALGIYNIAPSLDFDRDPKIDELLAPITSPSKANSQGNNISVDRNFNPFEREHNPLQSEVFNLQEMYEHATPAEPSKINLFEDEEFDEDLMRLPTGYWLYNKGDKTLMLDPGRMHRTLVADRNKGKKINTEKQALLFSLEYHLNEIEKNKYASIKKHLPELGYDMKIAQDNVLRIDAVPVGLKESQVIAFLENLFEILDYKTQEEFMEYYSYQWNKIQSKNRFDFIYKYEVEQLIKDFTKIGFPSYTPKGKICYIELPLDELKNKF